MKRFFAFFALCLFVLGACESPEPATPSISLPDEPIKVAAEGGVCRVNYELIAPNAQLEIVPTTDADWISKFAIIPEFITFFVEPNANLLESRTAEITITYGNDVKTIVIEQEKSIKEIDVEFKAGALNGEYEHNKWGSYNYFAILSEKGTTGWYDLYIDTYYRLDIFSDVAPSEDGNVKLPVGTYYYDTFSEHKPGTFAADMSARLQCLEDGTYQENYFTDGIIIVTETGIEAIFVLDDKGNNAVHHVVYEGSNDLKYLEIPAPDHYTSLTEDYIFDLTRMSQIYYYGDGEGVGLGNWLITTCENYDAQTMNGDYFRLDVYVDSLEYDPENVYGEYTAVGTISELKGGNFLGGVFGSWLYYVEDGYMLQGVGAPLVSGTIKVEKADVGALITIDCVDDLNHKVSGTINCPSVEFFDLR